MEGFPDQFIVSKTFTIKRLILFCRQNAPQKRYHNSPGDQRKKQEETREDALKLDHIEYVLIQIRAFNQKHLSYSETNQEKRTKDICSSCIRIRAITNEIISYAIVHLIRMSAIP